ncbi:MAG TPA: hypothetical protein VHZ81_12210 [Galbitalea sp.]|jgi:hypothetical protein|nr:hypothetical protein [Galbitalea sp.]
MKKVIAAVATLFIAVALSIVAVAAPASAHTAQLSGYSVCDNDTGTATITWTLVNQWSLDASVSSSSNTSVIPTGTTLAKSGHSGDTKTFTQSVPAPAANVTESLSVTVKWSDNVTEDYNYSVKVQSTCVIPVKKDASASVTDTAAVCGAAETAAENTITNATWGTPTVTSTKFTVVATAISGHAFSTAGQFGSLNSNKTVDTFTVDLSPALSADHCKTASAAVTTTAATCNGPETVAEGAINHATWSPITYNQAGTSYTAIATAASGYEFSNGHTTLTLTGNLDAALTGHVCEDYIIVAWHMPSWVDSTTPTWSQTYFTSQEEQAPDLNALDSKLVEACGVQYQVDIYYNSPTTASLIQGGFLDGPNNPPEDLIPGGWGVAYKLVQGPKCATPVTPTESDSCTAGGTITITPADGVTYYLDGTAVDTAGGTVVESGLTGSHTVTATASSGYLLSGYPDGGYTFNINTNCTVSYNSSGECTSSNGVSNQDVTLTLVNPSNSPATFVITSTDSTVTNGTFIVPANTTENEDVGSTTSTGGTFDVSVNGGPSQTVTVASFTGCLIVTAGDPFLTQATCNRDENVAENNASITVDLETGLIYSISGPNGFSLTNLTPDSNGGATGNWIAASGLAPGTYTVSVVADTADGYVLDPSMAATWPFTLALTTPVCDIGVSVTPADCAPPIQSGQFSTDTGSDPTIMVDLNPNVVYTARKVDAPTSSTVLVDATTVVASGEYFVDVTLSATGSSNGFSLPGGVSTLTYGESGVGSETPFDLTGFCPPIEATVNVGASGSNAVCTAGVTTDGVITLDRVAGQDSVTYKVVNTATNQVVVNDSTTASVNVPAGTYSVLATPQTGDGISGNTQSLPEGAEQLPNIEVTTDSTDCGGSLAFTGGTIAWLGFVLAGGMLFLGFALLYMRRRGHRTAE